MKKYGSSLLSTSPILALQPLPVNEVVQVPETTASGLIAITREPQQQPVLNLLESPSTLAGPAVSDTWQEMSRSDDIRDDDMAAGLEDDGLGVVPPESGPTEEPRSGMERQPAVWFGYPATVDEPDICVDNHSDEQSEDGQDVIGLADQPASYGLPVSHDEHGELSWDDQDLPDVDSPVEDGPQVPAAFSELPCVRLAYLQAVIANSFSGRTVIDCNQQLTDSLDLLELVHALPTSPKPATTLVTARSRLGLDIDVDIEERAICTICFKHYSSEAILLMVNRSCTEKRCKGIIYREETTTKGCNTITKRVPMKIQPYSSLIKFLHRLLARPGFTNLLRDSTDDVGRQPHDCHFPMSDIHDGDLWPQHQLGLKHVIRDNGSVRGIPFGRDSGCPLISNRFGFNFTINLDW